MTVKSHLSNVRHVIGALAVLGILQLGLSDKAAAQTVDLGALGINWNFETPELAHSNTAESFSTANIGPGWTLELLNGSSSNFGVQDPIGEGATPFYCCFSGPAPTGTLPAPFEGRQLGFINLNDDNSSRAQIVSDSIGGLLAGQTYTLNVAVGARATDDWANVKYDIGLRTVGGVELGTFATTTLDPATTTPTNITDLTYTLNVNTEAAAFVGQDVSIVIRGTNVGGGPSPPDTTQANFDNVRLSGTLSVANEPLLTVNRTTGAVTLSKTGATPFNIAGYQLSSDSFGSFNQASWTSIANNYDKPSAPTPGNGSVDPDNAWTILAAPGSDDDLSEAELEGGNGGTLSTSINLGTPWRRTPYEDVQASLLLTNGTELIVPVQYTGNAIAAGDLNADGSINQTDWTIFKSNHAADLSGMSIAEAYPFGDMNRDRNHNLADFSVFRAAFDAANGAGAFAAMVAAVPEPASALLLSVGAVLGAGKLRRRSSASRQCGLAPSPRRSMSAAALAVTMAILTAASASAQSVIAHWTFDAPSITTDANGILTAADTTGNHNAARTNAAAGVLPINSVVGQFGQAAQFTNVLGDDPLGASRLEFSNLTEIMGPTGGDFSVAAWANIAVGHTNQPNTILSDWSNTHTYWFLSQNVDGGAAARPRGQIRDTDGTDIIANTPTGVETLAAVGEDNFADGLWHHYAWTYEKAPGTMTHYIDGVVVDTVTTGNADHDVRTSANLVAHLGWKQDSDDHFADIMDEVWVVNGLLTAQQVNNIRTTNTIAGVRLTLLIDQATGQMQIRNNEAEPLNLSSYEIASASGGLDESGWASLASRNAPGFPSGNGSGNGWESGPNTSDNELIEWFLTGESTLAPTAAIGLGAGYDEVQDATDIVFRYTTATGSLVDGAVAFGFVPPISNPADFNGDNVVNGADLTIWRNNFGSTTSTKATGSADGDADTDGNDFLIWQRNLGATTAIAATAAVPEPTSWLLLAMAGAIVARRRIRSGWRGSERRGKGRGAALLAGLLTVLTAASAQAAYTLDRDYRFGEEEGGVPPNVVTITFDSAGAPATGTFHDLSAAGSTPMYVSVNSGPLARPNADGPTGIQFDGVGDYLTGLGFNRPSTTPSSTGGTPPGPLDYTGLTNRGFQLWVRPEADGPANQSIVRDTDDHGVMIEGGTWRMRYDEATTNSGVAVVNNQWHHVMVVRPFGALAPNGGSILYLNGVAIAADVGDYGFAPAAGETDLRVGANLAATPADFFKGTLDHLEMFVLGTTLNGVNRGAFNFATDNKFAASVLTGVAGDVNQDTVLNAADVTAFIAGWKSVKALNGVRVGDITTILDGDLNFDGITNLRDAALLRTALGSAGLSAAGLNALGVPEPSAFAVAATLACLLMPRGFLRAQR